MKKENYFSASRITTIAIFAALATVLYLVRIPLSFAFPSFLELNLSDIPALIGTFALGPVAGCIVVIMKILLKLLLQGTSTAFVGELADLIIGFALVIPAGIIYSKNRNIKGAILALVVGALCSTAAAVPANRFILIPFFRNAWGMDAIVGAMKGLFPDITNDTFFNYYLWISVVPFNLLRCLVASLVTFPVYKKISSLIKHINDKFDEKHTASAGVVSETEEVAVLSKRKVITVVVCVAVVLAIVAGVLIRYFVAKA